MDGSIETVSVQHLSALARDDSEGTYPFVLISLSSDFTTPTRVQFKSGLRKNETPLWRVSLSILDAIRAIMACETKVAASRRSIFGFVDLQTVGKAA